MIRHFRRCWHLATADVTSSVAQHEVSAFAAAVLRAKDGDLIELVNCQNDATPIAIYDRYDFNIYVRVRIDVRGDRLTNTIGFLPGHDLFLSKLLNVAVVFNTNEDPSAVPLIRHSNHRSYDLYKGVVTARTRVLKFHTG